MRVGAVKRTELHHLAFDLIPPRTLDIPKGKARTFLFVIDESLLNTESPIFAQLLDNLAKIQAVARDTDQIGLITFAESVCIADVANGSPRIFTDFNPSLVNVKKDFFAPAPIAFPSISTLLNSFAHTKREIPLCLFSALRWATALLDRVGGRILLFTSGKATDPVIDLLSSLFVSLASLSVFKRGSLNPVDQWAQMTGGFLGTISQTAAMCELFETETAWYGSAVLRMPAGFRTAGVFGPCGILEEGQVLVPQMTAGQAIVFEIASDAPDKTALTFQFAFRYFDDKGILKVRVVNGEIPVVQEVETPLDAAALALYISRKRVYEQQERLFNQRVGISKRFVGQNSALSVLLFTGSIRDPGFVVAASVERLALSVLVSEVRIGERSFEVVWGTETAVVFPKAEEGEEMALRETGKLLGVEGGALFYPDSAEEFRGMQTEVAGAGRWFDEIHAPLAAEELVP
jgi:hypothetical protein